MFHPKVVYYNPEEERTNSVVKYIANRVNNHNKNFLCAITGPTGSGKTWTSGSIAELYSKMTGIPYNAKDHVVFKFSDFIRLVNNGEAEKIIQHGSVITFDEPQVSINSRSWQSQINQAFNALLSTFRIKRLVVFFATPYMEFLDLQTRTLFHAEFEMKSIDKERGVSKVKPYFLEYNPKENKFYRKYLDVVFKSPGKTGFTSYDLKEWEVPKPSEEWIEIYERRKKAFTDELNLSIQQKLEKMENKDKPERKGIDLVAFSEDYDRCNGNYAELAKLYPNLSGSSIFKYASMVRMSKKTKILPQ